MAERKSLLRVSDTIFAEVTPIQRTAILEMHYEIDRLHTALDAERAKVAALASALDRALTCWRDPEMRASAHFDAAMDDLARMSPAPTPPTGA